MIGNQKYQLKAIKKSPNVTSVRYVSMTYNVDVFYAVPQKRVMVKNNCSLQNSSLNIYKYFDKRIFKVISIKNYLQLQEQRLTK
jgi:hypothetical protein